MNLLGDGVFRTMRLQDGEILHLERHLDKLKKECAELLITPKLPSKNELDQFIQENQGSKGLFRMKIAIAAKNRLDLTQKVEGTAFLSLEPYQDHKKPLSLGVYQEPFHRLNYKVKALSYLDQLTLLAYAKNNGYDDVLTLSQDGYVLESATSNLFWEDMGFLCFIDQKLPYYQGLMQTLLIEKSTLPIRYCRVYPKDLQGKQLFLCNSLKGPVPVNPYKVNI